MLLIRWIATPSEDRKWLAVWEDIIKVFLSWKIRPNRHPPDRSSSYNDIVLIPISKENALVEERGANPIRELLNMTNDPNPYRAPEGNPPPYLPADSTTQGDATGGVIPYKNPKALIAYYLGILSGLPLIGLPFGMAAFVLGIMGLRDRRRNPAIKGSIHAGIGIGCGGLFTLLWGFVVVAMIASMFVK